MSEFAKCWYTYKRTVLGTTSRSCYWSLCTLTVHSLYTYCTLYRMSVTVGPISVIGTIRHQQASFCYRHFSTLGNLTQTAQTTRIASWWRWCLNFEHSSSTLRALTFLLPVLIDIISWTILERVTLPSQLRCLHCITNYKSTTVVREREHKYSSSTHNRLPGQNHR